MFEPLAKSIVLASGLQDLRMVMVDHPLGGIGEQELQQRIDTAHEQVVAILGESWHLPPEPTNGDADVDAALSGLRAAFANDGAGLLVLHVDEQRIVVKVTFTSETCMECVMPPPALQTVIADTLDRCGFEQNVTVVDSRAR